MTAGIKQVIVTTFIMMAPTKQDNTVRPQTSAVKLQLTNNTPQLNTRYHSQTKTKTLSSMTKAETI